MIGLLAGTLAGVGVVLVAVASRRGELLARFSVSGALALNDGSAGGGESMATHERGVTLAVRGAPTLGGLFPRAEFTRAVAAAAFLAFALGCTALGLPVGAGAAACAVVIPVLVRRRRQARASELMESQLAEGIGSIAAGLRAGLSLSQAVVFAARESPPPIADALREIGDREEMGVPLGEALDEWAAASEGADLRLVASVLQLHRRTGGDLLLLLDRLAQTLSERRAAARETRSLTAQARLSGIILGFLPIGFFLFLTVMSPRDMQAAYRSPAGMAAIIGGLVMQGTAFLWIRSLLRMGS